MQISREFGLEINKEKSNIIIFNMEQQPDTIEDIKVVNKIKYLGIEIDNKRKYFKTQRQNMLTKARKMANLTYCIIEKSCNKLLIGKTYWKNIILPSILYGTNIMNLSEDDIRELQTIEYGVYRSGLATGFYCRYYPPVKTGPDNTPKSGFYRLLLFSFSFPPLKLS